MPDNELLQGDAQQVMAWVILALIAFVAASFTYFIKRLSYWEIKYDNLQKVCIKLAVRSQRAIEHIANLQPPEVEDIIDES